jgi:type IV pilus assembly protein PilZ
MPKQQNTARTFQRTDAMKFPVTVTPGYEGHALEMDVNQETVMLRGAEGQLLGTMSWSGVIDRILATDDEARFSHSRVHPRAPLAVKVRYTTPDGKQFDSLTGGIGGGGLFIESSTPLAPGTELSVEFALPDRPWERLKAKAKVAWTRNKPERYLLFPGMGVQFTNIDSTCQQQLVELVTALNRSRSTP